MNLNILVNNYSNNGYSRALAISRVCQDVILSKISNSNFNRNVTIKGGVVMMAISKDKRRATQDLDIDFIRYSLDDSSLEVLYLTMPISGINRIIQYTGRLHRTNENKKEIIVYDYIDDNFLQTRNMFLKRKKTYEKMGYEIIDKAVEQLTM